MKSIDDTKLKFSMKTKAYNISIPIDLRLIVIALLSIYVLYIDCPKCRQEEKEEEGDAKFR